MTVLRFPQVVLGNRNKITSLNSGSKSHNKSSDALALQGLLLDELGPPERRLRGDVLQSGLLAQVSRITGFSKAAVVGVISGNVLQSGDVRDRLPRASSCNILPLCRRLP